VDCFEALASGVVELTVGLSTFARFSDFNSPTT
jgi:hypothetical protein